VNTARNTSCVVLDMHAQSIRMCKPGANKALKNTLARIIWSNGNIEQGRPVIAWQDATMFRTPTTLLHQQALCHSKL